jgi:tRNA dimethylallyltransferase
MPKDDLLPRIARRVHAQFDQGLVDEVRALLADGLSATAHALSGLVYRQVVEMLNGVRDEAATRDLIIHENVRYARRQMTWFRSEPGVHWIEGPGETEAALGRAEALVGSWLAGKVEVPS